MSRLNYGRHLPAFILLFLAKKCAHGSKLLNKMKESMPYIKADGPAIYRALHELEKSEMIEACWDTTNPGAARKCYTITNKGLEQLKEFKNDIEERKRNFEHFLSEFDRLDLKE
ncbi:PadR family transcriptional regulator [Desulfosporosinus sp. BICA1-9]|uniref:PadR family transcriptional regulator n=1 Tax=Desulfosporosinus sp. BICA1-9 TaxID=1531958 RepID=UPI00054B680F|nr:PadR family transcriptional regulator [Desulfosporosinus sp. BICA1-9]KJS80988.1 MAG: PadR family transcriptional regulator [Desulfosporosinus sp. BICA1-9]